MGLHTVLGGGYSVEKGPVFQEISHISGGVDNLSFSRFGILFGARIYQYHNVLVDCCSIFGIFQSERSIKYI